MESRLITHGTDDEGIGVHGRLIWQPSKDRLKAFHLGLTGYYRLANVSDTFTNGLRDSTLRFRSKRGDSSKWRLYSRYRSNYRFR